MYICIVLNINVIITNQNKNHGKVKYVSVCRFMASKQETRRRRNEVQADSRDQDYPVCGPEGSRHESSDGDSCRVQGSVGSSGTVNPPFLIGAVEGRSGYSGKSGYSGFKGLTGSTGVTGIIGSNGVTGIVGPSDTTFEIFNSPATYTTAVSMMASSVVGPQISY